MELQITTGGEREREKMRIKGENGEKMSSTSFPIHPSYTSHVQKSTESLSVRNRDKVKEKRI